MVAEILWTIYLGILGAVAIGYLIKGKYKTRSAKLDFIISIITWLGLFGYVTETELLNVLFWKFVFVGALLWDFIYSFFFADYGDELEGVTPYVRYGTIAIMFVLLVGPLYYGLYNYAF